MALKLPEYAKAFLEDNNQQTIDLLLEYARIPAYSFKEEKRCAFLKNYLENLGAKDLYVDEVGNLVCPIGCSKDSTGICVMAAHMDTVYPDETPLQVEIKSDGRMVGPGVGDNSSSGVSLLRAHEIILRNHLTPKVPVIILYDVCEEAAGGRRGMRHFVETFGNRLKEIICVDAKYIHTFDSLLLQKDYTITVTGEQGSPYVDASFKNSIPVMNDFINELMSIEMPQKENANCNNKLDTPW